MHGTHGSAVRTHAPEPRHKVTDQHYTMSAQTPFGQSPACNAVLMHSALDVLERIAAIDWRRAHTPHSLLQPPCQGVPLLFHA